MIEALQIESPKRTGRRQTGWEGFFPYYAGYPEAFARTLLASSRLSKDAAVFDPWNGSGTTTYAATQLGLKAYGLDINPTMVVVARARLLQASEADSLQPLAATILSRSRTGQILISGNDPLTTWFDPRTARIIRSIEGSIRKSLLGDRSITIDGINIDKISSIAATLYVALFTTCRELVSPFRSTNPTWLRQPKDESLRISSSRQHITKIFMGNVQAMGHALSKKPNLAQQSLNHDWTISLGDTSKRMFVSEFDFVLTSPPYCTRIDYTAATRIELAILAPLLTLPIDELARRMIGSTKVPKQAIEPLGSWGIACNELLERVRTHTSKASATYYYRTHLDYFDKMYSAMSNISHSLKSSGTAVIVAQGSYYKDIHNDLPLILSEMGQACGMDLVRRENFYTGRSMSGINPKSRTYERRSGAVEAVLCLKKQ